MNATDLVYYLASQPQTPPFPPAPSRDHAIAIVCQSFQGIYVNNRMFWDPYLTEGWPDGSPMSDAEKAAAYAAKKAIGDTHVNLTIGPDGLNSLPRVLAEMRSAVSQGFKVLLMCRGDGNGRPDEPNYDPGSLGWYWLMTSFPAIVQAVTNAGLKPFTIFCPGYDGVVPGWQPFTRVDAFVQMARQQLGNDGYLALELAAGYWCWTGEADDWNERPAGVMIDTVLWEGAIDFGPDVPPPADFCNQPNDVRAPYDQIWQVMKRLLGSYWRRPSDMPACDDPGMFSGGPLSEETSRGPRFVVAFEYDTYKRVRLGQLTDADVARHRAYLKALGCPVVC